MSKGNFSKVRNQEFSSETRAKMSSSHKKPSDAEALGRRKIIRMLLFERGITNRNEIQRILKDEFGISVGRNCIYNDIKALGSISGEELSEFKLDIIGILRRNIHDLQGMIDTCDNVKGKASLMKTLSQLCKDEVALASSLAIGKGGSVSVKRDVGDVVIRFG